MSVDRRELVGQLPFSERSRAVIEAGKAKARQNNHIIFGSEYLLIGLLADERISAALDVFGATQKRVISAFDFIVPKANQVIPDDYDYENKFTERTREILGIAQELSIQSGSTEVEPEHILRGIMIHGEGIASGILEALLPHPNNS